MSILPLIHARPCAQISHAHPLLQPGRHPGHSGIKRNFESRQGAAARGRFCCATGRRHLHVAVICFMHSCSAQDDEQSRPTPPAENALINELIREYQHFPAQFDASSYAML